MAKKAKREVKDEEVQPEEKAPKRKAKVAKPESGGRPLSVGGIINKGPIKRDWEDKAPWNRTSKDSRFSTSAIKRAANSRAKD